MEPISVPATPDSPDVVGGLSPGREAGRAITRTVSTSRGTVKVTFSEPTPQGLSPARSVEAPIITLTKAWQRRALQELQEQTRFSTTELEALLHHFEEHQTGDNRLDRRTFIDCLGHAFGTTNVEQLEHIFMAMDVQGTGFVDFKQFVCALSTFFRGQQDEYLTFWFRMYDKDHDGYLTKEEFETMMRDVNTAMRKTISVYVETAFEPELDGGSDDGSEVLLSWDDFKIIMQQHEIIPIFVNPQHWSHQKQPPALRDLLPVEREVLALLGSELHLSQGELLIEEGVRSANFFFLLEGAVELSRQGVPLDKQGEGSFLGEAALFDDIKQKDSEGNAQFTTSARVEGPTARILRMNIHEFYPLVYHEHPGATAIVQRLGRVMLERLEQTENRLQQILATQQTQSAAGMRLSSADWAAFRKRLTRLWALRYHRIGRRGKLEVVPTKMMGTKEDLSVAYSPGVAEPCVSIQQNPAKAYEYTAKGHLVGVITNGTAVLGLGNIGALAGKPVMEGKAVLFKKFADLDSFDIEINEDDPERLVNIIVALEPTFGGVNLEDIKAPECFYVERECQKRMNIPVFHDDQHGTAIIAGAGLLNALELVDKDIADVRVVVCGVGAAGYTCAMHFRRLGVLPEHVLAVDVRGVVYAGREDLVPDNYLCNVAVDTPKRTLKEALDGADVFLGLSAGNLLTPEMLLSMARDPIVFACANPIPEIDPAIAREVRPDCIIATGRSDFPNQINNVCAFPYIFRGALDCRARKVNEEMKLAATYAIAKLAKEPAYVRKAESFSDLMNALNVQSAGKPEPGPRASDSDAGSRTPSDAAVAGPVETAAAAVSPTENGGLAHEAAANGGPSALADTNGGLPPLDRHSSGSNSGGSNGNTHTPRERHHRRRSLANSLVKAGPPTATKETTAVPPVVFGRNHIIPKPFDERLLPEVALAVVEAAIQTGVAGIADMNLVEYKQGLVDLVGRTSH